jgi:HK97 family phage major capsid protein
MSLKGLYHRRGQLLKIERDLETHRTPDGNGGYTMPADKFGQLKQVEDLIDQTDEEIGRHRQTIGDYLGSDKFGGVIQRRPEIEPLSTRDRKYEAAYLRYLAHGRKSSAEDLATLAMQSDSDIHGGFVSMPEHLMLELLKLVDDKSAFRSLCRRVPMPKAMALKVATRTAKASTFAWGSELQAPTEDNALRFGQRKLEPHYMSGEIVVSRDLLRISSLANDVIRDELSRDAGELQETAFMTGDGAQKPLGIFTASDDGISTARDVAGTNTTTVIGADTIFDMSYALKDVYFRNSTWLLHRTVVKAVRKLKDTANQYIWEPGLQPGEPDLLNGRPVVKSEFAPSTMTTGLYVGMLGDFSNYWIADVLDVEVLPLFELLARTNQVSYLARMKVDGAPVREEAFARMKMADA